MTRRRNQHRGDASPRPGYLRKGDTVWAWSVLDDAYVLIQSTGPTDMVENAGRLPEDQEGGKPTPELGKLKPRQLDRHLSEDLYGTDLDDED